jgi:hypothetical protein
MYTRHTMFSLWACTITLTSALRHEEATAATEVIRTMVVTVTHTIDQPLHSDAALLTDPTLTCPSPNEPCIIDGIAIWPNDTTSLVLPIANLDVSTFPSATYFASSSLGKDTTSTTSAHSTPCTSHTPAPEESDWVYSIQPIDPPAQVPSKSVSAASVQTPALDPIAWSGMDGALEGPSRRVEESAAPKRRRSIWQGFFVGAYAQQIVRDEDEVFENDGIESEECYMCAKGRSLVCINGTHFGYCDEGCAEPRKLRDGTKCVEGKMYGARLYRG